MFARVFTVAEIFLLEKCTNTESERVHVLYCTIVQVSV